MTQFQDFFSFFVEEIRLFGSGPVVKPERRVIPLRRYREKQKRPPYDEPGAIEKSN